MLNTLLFVACLYFGASCTTEQHGNSEIKGELYANEYGEVRLIRENDTLMRTLFRNNQGDIFDTTMFINYNFNLILKQDSLPFLQFHTGGIELRHESLLIHEFSSIAYLSQFIQIEEMYTRPFFKIGKKVTVTGDMQFAKGRTSINGIYLKGYSESAEGYLAVHGTIDKEKYPIGYYSTNESPQGMFADTGIIHYRLVMKDYTIEEFLRQTYKGKTTNINGQAAFIYEFSDSEPFYFDNKTAWTKEELDKDIEIEAVLIQFIDGKSVLKNWKLINRN